MLFTGESLKEALGRTDRHVELRNDYGRHCRTLSAPEAMALDPDLFVGVGNRRRIRFLRPCTQHPVLNSGSRNTQRIKDDQGVRIAHPLMREHRPLRGFER